ncbi:MAG: hypothetical protein KDJ65_24885 [Anaerolineae bacterium]|nr:hypothetical protein [Anaerolineae bacterium]
MRYSTLLRLIRLIITAMTLLLFLVGCGGNTSASLAEAPPSTQSAVFPTSTPKLPTPEPTLTPVPKTPKPTPVAPTSQPSNKGKLVKGQITSQALADNLIGDPATRHFYVYLPADYDTRDKHYPVIYVLHGFWGNESDYIGMGPELDKLTAGGEVGEMILVFLNADNKFGGSQYLSSPTIGDYERYITEELVSYIDANYRTLPQRDSRGITGCSMGGDGSLHLALTYPEVFSVAAPMSGMYDAEHDPMWEIERLKFGREPENFDDVYGEWFISFAAGAASNPDKPPFYLDMPFKLVDGKGQIVPKVRQKIIAADVIHDVPDYLNQPVRLRGLLIYHGEYDGFAPVEVIRDFDKMLTELGVAHEYVEVKANHCNMDRSVVFKFMADHLIFDQADDISKVEQYSWTDLEMNEKSKNSN